MLSRKRFEKQISNYGLHGLRYLVPNYLKDKGTYGCCAPLHYEHKWWNRELTLKCILKCYVKPMKDPLGVSPSEESQGTTRGKEKFF